MLWLRWREAEDPQGAILADDMGLGKTLTVLAYLKLTKDVYEKRAKEKIQQYEDDDEEEEEEEDNDEENEFDDRKYLKSLKKKKKNRMKEKFTSKRL